MDSSTNTPDEHQAPLACERCRRRKIKCDRTLPTCRICLKSTDICVYPLVSHKPGPKPGVLQRRRKRSAAGLASPPKSLSDHGISHTAEVETTILDSTPSVAPTVDSERSTSRGLSLSQLIHPSHEPVLQNGSELPTEDGLSNSNCPAHICESLGLSIPEYHNLVNAYFDNITAFSLFHRPSFFEKIVSIPSTLYARALLASMFSLSARYTEYPLAVASSQNKWRPHAQRLVEEALQDCSDDVPPLCLLQAMILTTFQQLISGVRGRAWRSVGACVRIAYELQLHIVDKNPHLARTTTVNEEKRRAWWVIWEFDVFASTILRLPTAIDWTQNATYLPIDDEIWFSDAQARSCLLDPDPAIAWKLLQASGNRSLKAWFILVNALMRCANLLSYPQSYLGGYSAENVRERLDVLANAHFCLTAAIPGEALYNGEFLSFSTCPENRGAFQLDGAKHSLHIMIQLSRFMINHYQVFDSTSRRLAPSMDNPINAQQTNIDDAAWTHYLGAASEIVKLVRGCAPKHVNYVNPFLTGAIWLAAAAQVISKAFSNSPADRRVAASNLDVLQMNLNAFVDIWGVSAHLLQKLASLEARLTAFKQHANNNTRQASMQELRPLGASGLTNTNADTGHQAEPEIAPMLNSGVSTSWPTPGIDWTDTVMNEDFGSTMWGWGMDELLQYGVN